MTDRRARSRARWDQQGGSGGGGADGSGQAAAPQPDATQPPQHQPQPDYQAASQQQQQQQQQDFFSGAPMPYGQPQQHYDASYQQMPYGQQPPYQPVGYSDPTAAYGMQQAPMEVLSFREARSTFSIRFSKVGRTKISLLDFCAADPASSCDVASRSLYNPTLNLSISIWIRLKAIATT